MPRNSETEPRRRAIFLRHLRAWAVSDPYRNLLSAAGLVIGVAGIIVALGLVIGESRDFMDRLRLVGFRSVFVAAAHGSLPRVTAAALRHSIPEAELASEVVVTRLPVRTPAGQAERAVPVLGVQPSYFRILATVRVHGRPLSAVDERLGNPVAVLGQGLADRLGRPQTVYAGGSTLKVVGVLEVPAGEGAETGLAAADPGSAILVPASLGLVRTGRNGVRRNLLVQAHSASDVESLKAHLAGFFARRAVAEVEVLSSDELLRRYRSTRGHLAAIVGAFAALALLLGGFGILNNMFSVVLERLPEIGIRISMGATRRDIVVQFVAETLVITVGGALVGMVLGLPTALLIAVLDLAPVALPWWLPVLPPLIGVAIGVLCGTIPAARAARLNPIETLTFR